MEENQTNQNLNQQQPVQPVQPQPEQVQQPVQGQPVQQQPQAAQQPVQGQPQTAEQPSVSMEIQQLLVQQQQYQKQYNELVDYVKKTPNLPLEQINQIKLQLDQLNTLFVEGKQKLEELGYNQVQVNKPTEIKKGAKINFSFKKLAIGCGIVLFLILTGLFVALWSLIRNPDALSSIGVGAYTAKILLKAFTGLIFGSVMMLMLGVIVSNIYRLITVKNQSRVKNILGLFGGIFGLSIAGGIMGLIFMWIARIQVEQKIKYYDVVQPYLIGIVTDKISEFAHSYDIDKDGDPKDGENYPLIAPSEMAFALRRNELDRVMKDKVKIDYSVKGVTLSCGNKDGTVLELSHDVNEDGLYKFDGTCLYSERGKYTYSINVSYSNTTTDEVKNITISQNVLNFTSEIQISKTTTNTSSSNNKVIPFSSSNGEFILGRAPAKITVDATQVFRDFSLFNYDTQWDMDGDYEVDRVNQSNFDYSYKIPQVYYVTYKFPGLSDDTWYRFPVRVEQSDRPVCDLVLERFPGTTKYQISTEFMDPTDATRISSYNYTIKKRAANSYATNAIDTLKDESQEFNYTFPEKGNFVVVLDYVTTDGKQGQCESDLIQLKKETFEVQYSILAKNPETGKFKELCSSRGTEYKSCKEILLDTVPQTYQLQIKAVSPSSNTTKRIVSLNETMILNENDIYTFDIPDEGTYELGITMSDVGRGMEEETIEIKFVADKADIVGNMSITSASTRQPISEGFEPLPVILDVSKTEINVPGDEIVYFTWDFGDGEIKENQQNAVVAHTYNYDYRKENGIFQPKVTIHTLQQRTQVISGPILNIKKGLINVDISSVSHPSRQAPVGKEVRFAAEFDGVPEKMTRDFGDGSPTESCEGRDCSEMIHTFNETGIFSIKLSLEFDAVQQVDGTMDFKVY